MRKTLEKEGSHHCAPHPTTHRYIQTEFRPNTRSKNAAIFTVGGALFRGVSPDRGGSRGEVTDIQIYRDHMTIYLPKCSIIYIAKTGSRYCPVGLLEEFFRSASVQPSEKNVFVIPRLITLRKGHRVHAILGISYTTAREVFVEHIQVLSKGGSTFSPHSLRAGIRGGKK